MQILSFIFREKETAILKEQIDKLNSQISREETKAADLKTKARYIPFRFSLIHILTIKY